ncbi:hypothetical protein [Lysinibacillus sp. Bpr_S20]|uniref:hypothetical protein n=1 Tax=Lysinibacillus sp. Bpr_S20 TaxID=2933964 RepID=UPI0020111D58|nr:hypothetical protein [Lysinibacillus sp. Bpr_S20]MCL1702565.1 hypothetical protein [Lysinibacillus sp. Bpr_S20]
MKIYKLATICTSIILLTGCTTFSSNTKVASKNVTSDAVKSEPVVLDSTQMEKDNESIATNHPIEIDEEITAPIGESKSYFTYGGDVPFKISVSNTGTKSFLYKIRNLDKETKVVNGVLKSNESFEKVFKEFPKGAYVISYVVEDEESPVDIKLKVKVELLP